MEGGTPADGVGETWCIAMDFDVDTCVSYVNMRSNRTTLVLQVVHGRPVFPFIDIAQVGHRVSQLQPSALRSYERITVRKGRLMAQLLGGSGLLWTSTMPPRQLVVDLASCHALPAS